MRVFGQNIFCQTFSYLLFIWLLRSLQLAAEIVEFLHHLLIECIFVDCAGLVLLFLLLDDGPGSSHGAEQRLCDGEAEVLGLLLDATLADRVELQSRHFHHFVFYLH